MLWVFDINETLLDLSPLDTVFAEEAGAAELRRAWFDLLIRGALVVTATGGYRDFAQLGAECARAVGLPGAAIARLGATMRALPAHTDVPGGLAALRERGDRLVALGNSPRQVIESQLGSAGIARLFDGWYSAEQAGMLKPAPAPYRFVLGAEDVSPERAVLVAAHDWDIAGAQAVGMRTVFVTRDGRRPLPGWPDPDLVVTRLDQVAELPGDRQADR